MTLYYIRSPFYRRAGGTASARPSHYKAYKAYNDYLTRKAAIDNEYNNKLINFNNTINEKKGENLVSLFNNSNAAIQDILNRREQRNNERNTIAAYLASNPNVNPRLFTRLGIDGVFTPEMIEAWEKEYKNNKNKTKTN